MSELEQLERKTRLWHIEKAAREIEEFVQGRTLQDYDTDGMLRLAIERNFTIIGEAMARALESDPDLVDRITDAPGIIAFRNQIIHNYPRLRGETVWEIITTHLPLLLAEVRALLAEP